MKISIIIPCFNNEGSLWSLINEIDNEGKNHVFFGHSFEYILIDDGSVDQTFLIQKAIKERFPEKTRIIKLTRNFGSYNSLLAGMYYASGDVNVYIHADLQDPPELIPEMFSNYLKGFKVVIANRKNRSDGSIFSAIYHIMMKNFGIKNIPPGGFDLIMFDKDVRQHIVDISEKNTNNVYLISWLGFPYVNIPYDRKPRLHGKSQWSLRKKIRLFVDTIFSFTQLPIWAFRILVMISTLFVISSAILWLLHSQIYFQLFIISIIILPFTILLWIVGEYLDRIHESVRKRPNFVVESIT
jgi:polyisoprenyl-phosphate glycosyltransferase